MQAADPVWQVEFRPW